MSFPVRVSIAQRSLTRGRRPQTVVSKLCGRQIKLVFERLPQIGDVLVSQSESLLQGESCKLLGHPIWLYMGQLKASLGSVTKLQQSTAE